MELKAHTTNHSLEHWHEDITTELLQWDKKHNITVSRKGFFSAIQKKMTPTLLVSPSHKRILHNIVNLIILLLDPSKNGRHSLSRAQSTPQVKRHQQCFHQYNKQTKLFNKFLNAWSSYCNGTQEDAVNMIYIIWHSDFHSAVSKILIWPQKGMKE